MVVLIKLSAPGWDFEGTPQEVKKKLYQHICSYCIREEGISEDSPIEQKLATACGCEFVVEDSPE